MHFADSPWSIVPPLLAVALAIITRRVLLSLGVGIVAGSLMLQQFSPLQSLRYLFDSVLKIFWVDGAPNSDNLNMLLFMLLLGGLISLMTASGATRAFAEWAARRCQSRKSAKSLTGLMVFAFFIDDFFHSFVGGAHLPPCDRQIPDLPRQVGLSAGLDCGARVRIDAHLLLGSLYHSPGGRHTRGPWGDRPEPDRRLCADDPHESLCGIYPDHGGGGHRLPTGYWADATA